MSQRTQLNVKARDKGGGHVEPKAAWEQRLVEAAAGALWPRSLWSLLQEAQLEPTLRGGSSVPGMCRTGPSRVIPSWRSQDSIWMVHLDHSLELGRKDSHVECVVIVAMMAGHLQRQIYPSISLFSLLLRIFCNAPVAVLAPASRVLQDWA